MMNQVSVVFLEIHKNTQKIKKIIDTVAYHFEKKEPFQFIVSDENSKNFLDDLLWKTPITGFLPHKTSNLPCNDMIIITLEKEILNQAKTVFNLTQEPLNLNQSVRIIYEFDDQSNPEKTQISKKKYHFYKEQKYYIESR